MNTDELTRGQKCVMWTISAMDHLCALGYVGGGATKATTSGETMAARLRETGFVPTDLEIRSCLAYLGVEDGSMETIMRLIQMCCIEQWAELPPAE